MGVTIPHIARERDIELLEMLDAYDRLGLRGDDLRAHLRGATGAQWTNGRVQGVRARIRHAELPCACAKPEDKDGGMPERWWADGR